MKLAETRRTCRRARKAEGLPQIDYLFYPQLPKKMLAPGRPLLDSSHRDPIEIIQRGDNGRLVWLWASNRT